MSDEKEPRPISNADSSKKCIAEIFHDMLEVVIDEKGLEIAQAICLRDDGHVEVAALAVPPEQAYKWLLATAVSQPNITEIIMGTDRYTKPGQGNEFADAVVGVHWTRVEGKKGTFRGFVIDYQFGPPKIVRPVNYENHFWNEIVKNEFQHVSKTIMNEVAKRRLLSN